MQRRSKERNAVGMDSSCADSDHLFVMQAGVQSGWGEKKQPVIGLNDPFRCCLMPIANRIVQFRSCNEIYQRFPGRLLC